MRYNKNCENIPNEIVEKIVTLAMGLKNYAICEEIRCNNFVKNVALSVWGDQCYNDFIDYAHDLFDGCPSFINFNTKREYNYARMRWLRCKLEPIGRRITF